MNETTDAAAMFAPVWRHKWLIVMVGAVAALGSYLYYNRQEKVYKTSTQLYLGGGSEAQQPGLTAPKASLTDREVADQAALINSNLVGEAVRARLRREHRLVAADGTAHAKSSTGSDFITIATEARSGQGAAELANAYSQAYIAQRYAGYRREIETAIASARRQLHKIEAGAGQSSSAPGKGSGRGGASKSGTGSSGLVAAASLVSRINQLESELSVAGVQQISAAKPPAFAASPRPKRDALFAGLLGLLAATMLAYLLTRYDRRLRTPQEMESLLGAQVLAALPPVKAPLLSGLEGPVVAEPLSEPLRGLDTMIRLTNTQPSSGSSVPRTLLFLSADPGDGKSTLVAGLALAAREAGERVAAIDADLRRPMLAQLLGANAQYGLAEVLTGTLGLSDALQTVGSHTIGSVANGSDSLVSGAGATTMLATGRVSSLSVLVGGGPVANPSALFSGLAMRGLLASLAEDFDRVLIDVPPPLVVSDAMPLLTQVDGIVVVARAGHTRRASAERLTALLQRITSAPVLGVVANSVPTADIKGYGLYSARRERGLRRLLRR